MWPFRIPRLVSEQELADLRTKVAIVTGGYSGIGYGTVQFLARKGAKVYLATRNEAGTKEAMEKLKQEGLGEGTIHWLKIDLADPRSAKNAAQVFMQKEECLDILVNNAAKGFGPFHMTKDGLLDSMATNYLGHFILTENLLPLLVRTSKQANSDVRIINIASTFHRKLSPSSFAGLENFNRLHGTTWRDELATYGLSKLANILHIQHLQRRLNAQNAPIICMAVHPGAVSTPNILSFLNGSPTIVRSSFKTLLDVFFLPIRQGAMNSVYAAASPEIRAQAESYKGAFIKPVGEITEASPQARDERLANELYDTTLEILKQLDI